QPRPVGFKFHAVLVIHAAHQASLASTDKDRWLPLLWSIDYFKSAQQTNQMQGDWRMAPVDESKLPAPGQARQRFIEAMDNWDVEAADRAIAAWARCGSLSEIFEVFWRYGARDFRDIGHKAIFVANAWRVLQVIGTQHREPVLRSLAYALLDHEGSNPAKRDDLRDRIGRDNLARLGQFQQFRHAGQLDAKVPADLLAGLRRATPAEG
ncbi:MAG: hypothetical protein NZO58_14915, partial [Gemmataceae bacterium]|nr:hypothetical protein [Gemmataceae bacterium]